MKFLFSVFVCAFVLFSCSQSDNNNYNNYNYTTKSFYALDQNENLYTLQAELLVTGKYCNVWAEKTAYVDRNTAQAMANEYDNEIYSKVVSVFSKKKLAGNLTAIECADYYGDNDGKLCILLLDIKDNYSTSNKAYVAGYFYSWDLYDKSGSNRCDMIYIDTYPGLNNFNTACRTLAHELQHLLNFAASVVVRGALMDTWIDEGLSESAEWVYSGHSSGRINWFNNDPTDLIGKGNNFFIWGNHEDKNQNAVLDDYATVYLFFQWLRIQAGSESIYSNIMTSNKPDFNAVVNAMNGYSWNTLLKTWLAANYLKSNGDYGYRSDSISSMIKTPSIPSGSSSSSSISLYPGEGVYSSIKDNPFNPPSPPSNSNIGYAGLSSGYPTDNFTAGNVLLTYNSNTKGIEYDNNNNPVYPGSEPGTTTGTPISSSVSAVSNGRFISDTLSEPQRIGMHDLLRSNGGNLLMEDLSGLKLNREE